MIQKRLWLLILAAVLTVGLCVPASANTLQKGSKGDDVVLIQQQLIDLGFLTGAADGIFGSQTASAIKAFQRHEGLKQTGKLTDKQQFDLLSLWNIATDTSYAIYGGGSEDLSGVYPDTCGLAADDRGDVYFEYCYRHYTAEANLMALRTGPCPPQLEMMLAGNACRYWETWILEMYDEWEARASKSDKKTVRRYRQDFIDDLAKMRREWQAQQPADQPNWALIQEANWLEEVGIQQCLDLHGMEPQGK